MGPDMNNNTHDNYNIHPILCENKNMGMILCGWQKIEIRHLIQNPKPRASALTLSR